MQAKLLTATGLLALTSALPHQSSTVSPRISQADMLLKRDAQSISADDMHANVLANHPADFVTTSDKLGDLLSKHEDKTTGTVYLTDERVFVPISSVQIHDDGKNTNKAKRYDVPYSYGKYSIQNGITMWGPWIVASTCLEGTKSDAGGKKDVTWSYSVSVEESASFDFGVVSDALSASFGFSVTETWSHGETTSCNVNPYENVQVWGAHWMGYGDLWGQTCVQSGVTNWCDDNKYMSHVGVPQADDSGNKLGCSTGDDAKCDLRLIVCSRMRRKVILQCRLDGEKLTAVAHGRDHVFLARRFMDVNVRSIKFEKVAA